MSQKQLRTMYVWLALLLAIGLLLPGTAGMVYAGVDEEEEVGIEEEVTPLGDLTEEPEAFEDEEVTVEDEIGRAFGRSAFTLGDEEVLVISTERGGFDRNLLRPGTVLRATGRADLFDIGTFEREFGIRVNPRLARQFVGQPFIAVDPADLDTVEEEVTPLADMAEPVPVELEELAGNAEAYEGERVLVEGRLRDIIDLEEFVEDRRLPAFTVFTLIETDEFAGEEVLVVAPERVITTDQLEIIRVVTRDDTLIVTGEVFVFDLEMVEEQFGFAVDPERFEDFGGGTVIVADTVIESAEEEEGFYEEEQEEEGVPVEEDEPIFDVETFEEEVTPLGDLTEEPEAFEDEEVTVEDEIGRAFGRSAFTLGDEEVLVISTERGGFDRNLLRPGTVLRATGRADLFDIGTFEREFGIRVNPRLARQFVGQPFIAVDPADLATTELEEDWLVEEEGRLENAED